MLTILQIILIIFGGLVGWLLGLGIYSIVIKYKEMKLAREIVLLNLQRQSEEIEKMLENMRKENK